LGVGGAIAELLAPEVADDLRRIGGGAILQGASIIGGRTEIGAPIGVFKKSGTVAGIVLFGWPYVLLLVRSIKNVWTFVPQSRAEFVRIDVAESVSGRRLLPIIAYSVTVFVALMIAFGVLAAVSNTPFFFAIGFLPAYLAMNTVAAITLQDPSRRLQVSEVKLSYGFPSKVPLFKYQCDAPARILLPQIETLAGALTDFGTWNNVNVHGAAGVTVALP
jgi:hypothetical protein